jgi:hypothetical protein
MTGLMPDGVVEMCNAEFWNARYVVLIDLKVYFDR